jgi:hypothetical protein
MTSQTPGRFPPFRLQRGSETRTVIRHAQPLLRCRDHKGRTEQHWGDCAMRFRSRSKARAGDEPDTRAVQAPTQAAFSVGASVQLTAHAAVFPMGSTGKVIAVTLDGGLPVYELSMDANNKNPVQVPARNLKPLPGHFDVGTRVRLTQEFVAKVQDQNLAVDMDTFWAVGHSGELDGADLAYRKGATGTVMFWPEGFDEYSIQLDRSIRRLNGLPKDLFVHSSKIERISGATVVIPDEEGGFSVHQLFAYLDRVVIREDVPMQNGEIYEKGMTGNIMPVSFQLPVFDIMETSWQTHAYTVRFGWDPSNYSDGFFAELPAKVLQLESDLI